MGSDDSSDPSDSSLGASSPPVENGASSPPVGKMGKAKGAKETVVKGKKTVANRKPRKAVKKKPEDMPRRPLSAYNYFFSEMRAKLVTDKADGKDSGFQAFLDERGVGAEGTKKNGFFSNMGKFVASRWKALSQDEMKPFSDKADADLERYRKEMDDYREGVAKKTRLASETKLREQDNKEQVPPAGNPESAQPPSARPPVPGGVVNPGAAQPFGSPGQQPMQSMMMQPGQQFQGFSPGQQQQQAQMMQQGLDPTYQMLLRQQLLGSQNPQLSALLFQQQQQMQMGMGHQGLPMGMPGFQQFHGYGQAMFAQQPGMPGMGAQAEWFAQQQQQQQQPQQPGGGGPSSEAAPGAPHPGFTGAAYPQLSGQPFPGYGMPGGGLGGLGQQQAAPHMDNSQQGNYMMMMGGQSPMMGGAPGQQQQFLGYPPMQKMMGQPSPQQQQQQQQQQPSLAQENKTENV